MSALTIAQVRSWRPGVLGAAAGELGSASSAVDQQARAVGRSLESALSDAGGAWAAAATDRAAEEAKTGAQLADALDLARTALTNGAADIGTARSRLLDAISAAEAEGFEVGSDGSVTAPTLPPVMSSPDQAAAAAASRNRAQDRLNDRATAIAEDIGAALDAVASADSATAGKLGGIDVPQTLASAVNAYIERALASKDLLGSLGATGAGGIALAMSLKKAVTLFGRSKSFSAFLRANRAPLTDYQTFLKNMGASDDALKAFMNGKANGGFARFLIGSERAKLAGKAFIPLTVATGALDVVTGGGREGARGWATRGFGLAGAAGGGALLANSAGLVVLGPVGAGIAGAAVLGYGAWSLGNAVHDNWDNIVDFGGRAVDWVGDKAGDAAEGAKNWAEDRVAEAGRAVAETRTKVLRTVSFGLL